MDNIWIKFKEIYIGEQATREAFNSLCLDIMEHHFPGKEIIPATMLSAIPATEKSIVIYQPKYFLDNLSNSRKGQIRKAFNDSIEVHHSKKKPVFTWIFCVPMIFSEEEGLWWVNWSEKMSEEYNINIQLFDGEVIAGLLEKYNLTNKWLSEQKTEPETKTSIPENENDISNSMFELDEDSSKTNLEDKTDDIEFVIERHKEEEYVEKEETTNDQNLIIESENNKNSDSNNIDLDLDNLNSENKEKSSFHNLKSVHQKISENNKSLDDTEKSELEILFKKNKFNKGRFDFSDLVTDDFSTLDLVFKARQFKINENYEKALYIYEKVLERDDIKEDAKEEVVSGIELCKKMILYRNFISEGDYYFVKKDYLNALQSYETAFGIDNKRKEIIKKYNFTFAEALIEQKNYKPALEKYDEALTAEPNSKLLQDKRAFAQLMVTGNKVFKKAPASYLNPLLAPWFYRQAWKIDNTNADLNIKLKKASKNIFYTLIAMAALVVIALLIISIPPVKREIILTDASKALSMYDFQMQSGEYFLTNYSNEKIHYLDSAIYSFQNAIKFKPHDSIAPLKLQESKDLKEEYIRKAQEMILLDSAAYFLSMRNPSENLRLFKYLFEPYDKSKGKFGYVDEDLNIVVPPIFDFNYKKMNDAGERFKDGKAFVCLEVAPGDTLYFFIDKNSKRVE